MIKKSHLYYKYILILIGFGLVSWVLWARFLRPRVPKDISFLLTEYWFFIILYICLIYLYVVYSLIRPREPNEYINNLSNILYKPVTTLDASIKTNTYILPTYNRILQFIQSRQIKEWDTLKMKNFYIQCYIMPRIILVSILCLDTFYFNRLEFIYKIILLGLLPLIHRYLKYSLKYVRELYIKQLESKYSKIWLLDKNYTNSEWVLDSADIYHDKKVTVTEYVEIQTALILEESPITYIGHPYVKEEYYNQNYIRKYKKVNIQYI